MELEPKQFASAMAQICEEKGISNERAMEIVESALVAAYRKDYGKKGQNLEVKFNEVSGDMEVTLLKEVVETVEEEDGAVYILEPEIESEEEGQADKKEGLALRSLGEEGKSALAKAFEEAEKDKKEGKDKDIIKEDKEISEKIQEEILEETKPRRKYNPESHILLEEAKKTKKNAKPGDILTFDMPKPTGFGRIAAQTAKQVIIQRVREAEREAIYKEFHEKEGEAASGIIQRVERGVVYIDLGRTVGAMFPQDQIPGENYRIGMRVKAHIARVEANIKESSVILSRASESFLRKLFEMEVPEIFSGAVVIKALSREAGSRSKVAVASKEESVDPVGSCVGQKGTRVQTVINELNGEKIDIIEWNDDPKKLIANSLSPAKINNVKIKEEGGIKSARVEVPAEQLSLAIGRQGQNVRLAAKLTGWNIDVYSPKIETPEETKPSSGEASLEKSEEEKVEAVENAEVKKETNTDEEKTENK